MTSWRIKIRTLFRLRHVRYQSELWWQRTENKQPTAAETGTLIALMSRRTGKEAKMAESIYKVIQLVGSSDKSWEDAAKNAIEKAGQTLRDLRIAEVEKLDLKVEDGKVASYRARMNLSFKYGGGE
jgi:flavin-binding protein dodecin